MNPDSEGVDAYLAGLPEAHRAPLEAIRSQVKKLYPEATEQLSYGHPLFKWNGHPLVGFSSHKRHCAFFVWSKTALQSLGTTLDGYDTAESTIRFKPDAPLPESIIQAVAEARAKEIDERWGRKKSSG